MAFTLKSLLDGAGAAFNAAVWTAGRDAAASSQPVVLSTEDKAALDAAALPSPRMTSTGILRASTSAAGGATYVAFGSQVCKQAVLSNQSGAAIDIQISGAGEYFIVPSGAFLPIYGITNTNQIGIRRRDALPTQVSCGLNWAA